MHDLKDALYSGVAWQPIHRWAQVIMVLFYSGVAWQPIHRWAQVIMVLLHSGVAW